jgi:hypothetical protein
MSWHFVAGQQAAAAAVATAPEPTTGLTGLKRGVSSERQLGDQDLALGFPAQQDSDKEDRQPHHRGGEDRSRNGNLVGGRV